MLLINNFGICGVCLKFHQWMTGYACNSCAIIALVDPSSLAGGFIEFTAEYNCWWLCSSELQSTIRYRESLLVERELLAQLWLDFSSSPLRCMSLRGGSASVSTTSGEQTRGMERSYFVWGHFQVFFAPLLLENYHSPGTVSLFSDSFLLGQLLSPVGCLPPNSHFCFSIGLPDIKFPCGLLTLLLFWSPPSHSLFFPTSHISPFSFHH